MLLHFTAGGAEVNEALPCPAKSTILLLLLLLLPSNFFSPLVLQVKEHLGVQLWYTEEPVLIVIFGHFFMSGGMFRHVFAHP